MKKILVLLAIFVFEKHHAQINFTLSSSYSLSSTGTFYGFLNTCEDFNNDGNKDIASIAYNIIKILIGSGNGSFSITNTYSVTSTAISLCSADLNNDAKKDLIVSGGDSVYVLMGQGNGIFSSVLSYSISASFASIRTGDFNGDGNQDVVGCHYTSGVYILYGSSSGTLSTEHYAPTNGTIDEIYSNDFNSDSIDDIACLNGVGSTVVILFGSSSNTFSSPISYTTGSSPRSVDGGDLNGDNKLDLVIATSASISVLLGVGNGSFTPCLTYSTLPTNFSYYISQVRCLDLNCDNKLDIVCEILNLSSTGYNFFVLLPGNGNGTFPDHTIFTASGSINLFELSDFNNDTKPDLLFTSGNNFISIYTNSSHVFTVSGASVVCSGMPVLLNASDASNVLWSGGVMNNVPFTPTASSVYTVTGNQGVCPDLQTYTVTVFPIPTIAITNTQAVICAGETETINLNGDAISYSVNATHSSQHVQISPSITTTYLFSGENANGCYNSINYVQNVSACDLIDMNKSKEEVRVFPNPNNGTFDISSSRVEGNYELTVTNLMGEIVYDKILLSNQQITITNNYKGMFYYKINEKNKIISKGKIIIE